MQLPRLVASVLALVKPSFVLQSCPVPRRTVNGGLVLPRKPRRVRGMP
jgi:hypothetical protein